MMAMPFDSVDVLTTCLFAVALVVVVMVCLACIFSHCCLLPEIMANNEGYRRRQIQRESMHISDPLPTFCPNVTLNASPHSYVTTITEKSPKISYTGPLQQLSAADRNILYSNGERISQTHELEPINVGPGPFNSSLSHFYSSSLPPCSPIPEENSLSLISSDSQRDLLPSCENRFFPSSDFAFSSPSHPRPCNDAIEMEDLRKSSAASPTRDEVNFYFPISERLDQLSSHDSSSCCHYASVIIESAIYPSNRTESDSQERSWSSNFSRRSIRSSSSKSKFTSSFKNDKACTNAASEFMFEDHRYPPLRPTIEESKTPASGLARRLSVPCDAIQNDSHASSFYSGLPLVETSKNSSIISQAARKAVEQENYATVKPNKIKFNSLNRSVHRQFLDTPRVPNITRVQSMYNGSQPFSYSRPRFLKNSNSFCGRNNYSKGELPVPVKFVTEKWSERNCQYQVSIDDEAQTTTLNLAHASSTELMLQADRIFKNEGKSRDIGINNTKNFNHSCPEMTIETDKSSNTGQINIPIKMPVLNDESGVLPDESFPIGLSEVHHNKTTLNGQRDFQITNTESTGQRLCHVGGIEFQNDSENETNLCDENDQLDADSNCDAVTHFDEHSSHKSCNSVLASQETNNNNVCAKINKISVE